MKKTVSAFAGGSCATLNLPFLADNPCDDASAFHRVEAAQARDRHIETIETAVVPDTTFQSIAVPPTPNSDMKHDQTPTF